MAEAPIRAGIVGCGKISEQHFKGYESFDGAQIVACCDIDENAARAKAEAHGNPAVFTDYKAMFAEAGINTVSICSSSGTHHEIALAAAEAGFHMQVEKPMAQSLKQCDEMIAAAEKAGVVYAGIYQNRFNPNVNRVKYLVDKGALGTVRLVKVSALSPHAIDAMCWMVGLPKEVTAMWAEPKDIDFEEAGAPLVTAFRFDSGAVGTLVNGGGLPEKGMFEGPGYTVSIVGDRMSATVQLFSPHFMLMSSEEGLVEKTMAELEPMFAEPDYGKGHYFATHDFCRAILEKRDPMVTGGQQRMGIEMMTACFKAGLTEQTVTLPIEASDPYYSNPQRTMPN